MTSTPSANLSSKILLSYDNQVPNNASTYSIGDYLLDLSGPNLHQYIQVGETGDGNTGGTGTVAIGGWTGPVDSLNWSNQIDLSNAINQILNVRDISENIFGSVYLFDHSIQPTLNPTLTRFKINGPTGSEYNSSKVNAVLLRSQFRSSTSQSNTKYAVFEPSTNENYIISIGPLDNNYNPASPANAININYM